MRRHFATPASAALWLALPVLVALAAALAIAMHRTGHTQGDDFALYLRQARSIFDGDIGAVVADNRFSVLNSDANFSPIAYPWVWPLVLSPFVHLWGLDYDRLKLVEVGVYCWWLVLLHGIVRRRLRRLVALAVVAVFATAPAYLLHTDQLLTEIPHLAAVALVIWWYDRVRSRSSLVDASTADLVTLGALVTLAFNVRRESIVLLGVIAVMQMYDLARAHGGPAGLDGVVSAIRDRRRQLLTPYAAFAVTAAVFQLLLPTALLPDNGNDSSFLDDRMSEYPAILTEQLGLGDHRWLGVVILAVAAVGTVLGVRRRPTLDGPLALLGLLSAIAISTHLRKVDRYWFQVTPWVVYFSAVACVEGARAVATALAGGSREHVGDPRRQPFTSTRAVALLSVVPLLVVVVCHLAVLPGDVRDARDYDAAGRVQSGPSNPDVAPIFEAVDEFTPPDAIIAYYRARTMTLLTDRRSFQTKNLERIAQDADYFAQRRDSTYWQPTLTPATARAAGWEEIWSSPRWVLWRTPDEPS
jgi:hypothetical protein